MKKIFKTSIFFIPLVILAALFVGKYDVLKMKVENSEGKVKIKKKPIALEAMEQWTNMRAYPNDEIQATSFSSSYQELKAQMEMKMSQPDLVSAMPWQAIAPKNFAGRILCMAVSPTNSNTIFLGSASGGLWKSTTGGTGGPGGISWTYVPTGFPVLGVGAIVINPLNANEIYIGTGEVYNKNEKGVTPGGHIRTYRGFYGIGILKSTNGGATWTQVLPFNQSNLEGVSDMIINPLRPSTVYAATTDGLYRTTNSGANWTKIHSVLMAMDLAMRPNDTGVIVVACGNFGSVGNGIYKTNNAGAAVPTFTKLTSGLPASYTGMAKVAYAPSNRNKIFASIGHQPGSTTTYGLYLTTNNGGTWTKITSTQIINGQGWYAHDVVVDPTTSSIVYWSEIDIFKSTNGGSTMNKISSWSAWNLSNTTIGTTAEGAANYTHADNHRLYFFGGALYSVTDGGLFKSTNGGASFISLNGGLQTVQIYSSISVGNTDPNYMLLGLQDNGTFVYRGQPGAARVIGADGFSTAIDPSNDNIGFAQFYFFNVKKSTDKGLTFPITSFTNNYSAATIPNEMACFNSPIIFAYNNTNILYGGTIYLKKSVNKGTSWTNGNGGSVISGPDSPILTLAAAKTDDNVVYISTAPGGGNPSRMYVSTNGGNTVTNITGVLPNRYYSKIAVDPADKNRAVITLSGFGSSHVFITYNAGANWTDIGSGLPDVPHNTIGFDPNNTSTLYVGNDLGVYYANNVPVSNPGASSTVNWTNYNDGFTDATLVSDLLITNSNKIRLATFGRGLWERDLAIPPVMAIQLSEFQFNPANGLNQISWKARHEASVDYYELEFSKDGTNFQSFKKLSPTNRAEGEANLYQVNNANGQDGASIYRVKIVLDNGKAYYSGQINVQNIITGILKIIPNSNRGSTKIQIDSKLRGQIELFVVDMKGRLVHKEILTVSEGKSQFNLKTQSLKQGSYRLVSKGAVISNNSLVIMK